MKIIGVHRYDPYAFDTLIVKNVERAEGRLLVEKYNKRSSDRTYKMVEDDYVLKGRKNDQPT